MKKYAILIMALALLLLSFTSSALQNGYDLFQKALAKERGEGNLEEAIVLYKKVINETSDESLAAKAQLRIGICYEKLGMKQAQKAFQKVIDNYPGQTETVKVAKEKLSILMKAQTVIKKGDKEFKISLVWKGSDMDDTGEISPDNKYLSCVDWETGDLAVREMATGKRRHLTDKGSWGDSVECPDTSIWSPDSKQIAYNWYNDEPPSCDLRIIGLENKKPRILYQGDYFKDWVEPEAWSPCGKYILTSFLGDGGCKLGLVSVEDGSVRYLKTIHGIDPHPLEAQFSPDGQYIVFEFPQDQNSRETNISLISSDGKYEIPLIEHPADDRLLGWAPDGKNILFVSDRTGTRDAWIIQVSGGKPRGDPQLLRRDIGIIGPMGFTQDESFYYSTSGFRYDIFHVSINPKTGEIVDPPKKYSLPYEGHNQRLDLSPDGKSMVYISARTPAWRKPVLCIYSLESGEVRELLLKEKFGGFGFPHWTPDGQSILLLANHMEEGKDGVYKVDPQTGEATLLIREENEESGFAAWSPVATLDGKSVFYILETSQDFNQILIRDLETGKEKEFCRIPPYSNNTIALSSDGKRLALMMREEKDMRVLKVFQVTGGEPIELHRFHQKGREILDIDWSPDGLYIYFEKRGLEPENEDELWRIPSAGGKAQNLGLTMHGFMHIKVHPDGKRITFASRTMHEKVGAVWIMENFLPKEKNQKKSN